jgi:hypothetical protein
VGVYMEPRGRWTEKVWEPLSYSLDDVMATRYGLDDGPSFSDKGKDYFFRHHIPPSGL